MQQHGQSGVINNFSSYIYTEIGQIPLPRGAVIPSGPFTAGDLQGAINGHYNFIVANMKVTTFIILCYILL